jgi:pimeloyl-ACP methyl ester carboxylesterase
MTKPTIIFLHGFRGTHHGFALIGKHLPKFNVIVPDLPGFGEGVQLASYDLDSYTKWVKKFIEDQRLSKPPILVGHSFGSILSSAYAAKYPDTIERLILINPIGAPALSGPRVLISQLAVFYYWVGKRLPALLAQHWLSSRAVMLFITITMMKTKDKQLRTYIYDQHHQHFGKFHSPSSVAAGFRTSISHNVRDFAGKITVPTLLIVAEKDDITSLPQQEELHVLFKDAELKVIKDVGHLTHYETPDQIADLIQEFVKSR